MSSSFEKLVLPGDNVGVAEEYVPGRNVTEVDGKLVALVQGEVVKNDQRLSISIEGSKRKLRFFNGDTVYGQVTKSDQKQILISVAGVQKGNSLVNCMEEGYIRLGGGRRDEVHQPPVRIGDLIRGKVIRVGQNLELTLNGSNLGVLKSRCSRCRTVLKAQLPDLYCENCQRTENRKIAPDYGKLKI